MSQKEQKDPEQKAQKLNGSSVITYFIWNETDCVVSIISPDGNTHFFGNGIGKIIPDNHITRAGSKETSPENRKQYTIRFENGKWNIYLDEIRVHTFDEIFGLPDGTSHLENVSFRQFKYVPTAEDGTTETFGKLLEQLVSAYPDRFCLEDPKKQMEVRDGGTKFRIPQPIFGLVKQLLILLGVSTCSFVEHLKNGSKNGVCRGDMDLYVLNAKEAEVIIDILTKLEFVKDSTDKSNASTFRIYLDVLCQKFSDEAIIPHFNLPASSDPSQYYIEVEIKIATEFQKAYESNCLGYFLGLLLSYLLKISTSGISLKHGCDEIPINVCSFDDFLKKLGINLDGIQTTEEFIERLLESSLISELLTVDDILRLYKNIMGDEKMKHTSKPLREWLHLLLCGLKKRFPERFSSLKSELVEKMVCDEKSGQNIPTRSVQLFLLNQDSESEVQMEKRVLFIMCSGKKLFVSTGDDDMSLIFSETQLEDDSRQKALPKSMDSCSKLYKLLKDYFDHLKVKKIPKPQIEQFITALGCHLKVSSYLKEMKRNLTQMVCEEFMKDLFSVKTKKPEHIAMSGKVYGVLMKNLKNFEIPFSQFQGFCVENHHLVGDYPSFVISSISQIFKEYHFQIMALSLELPPEEHKRMRKEIRVDAMRQIEGFCLDVVKQRTLFYNSDLFWRPDETGIFHIPSNTSHKPTSDRSVPYYLGRSVLIDEDPSEPLKGKKQKGKPEGKPVHVFMDSNSGEVFTVPIAE